MLPSKTNNWHRNSVRREVERHAMSVHCYASRLEQRLDYPNSAPKDLARIIRNVSMVIFSTLPDAPENMLKFLSPALKRQWSILKCAERSGIKSSPWSMIPAFERFVKPYLANSAKLLMWPQWDYNYSILTLEMVGMLRAELRSFDWIEASHWERAFGDCPNGIVPQAEEIPLQIYSISFPRLERNNALMHSLLGHEIGHVLSQPTTQNKFNEVWQKSEPRLKDLFRKIAEREMAQKNLGELFVDVIASENVARAKSLVNKAFSELSADFLGLHLFGSAALAASAEFAACEDLDLDPLRAQGYPPWRYRLRSMFKTSQADLQNASPERSSLVSPLIEWLQDIGNESLLERDIESMAKNPISKAAYEAVNEYLPDLLSALVAGLPVDLQVPYRVADRLEILTRLVSRLEVGLPPNETGTWPESQPAKLADILNAGWAFKIMKLKKDPLWATYENIEGLFRLLLKAIEAAHVQEFYEARLRAQNASNA